MNPKITIQFNINNCWLKDYPLSGKYATILNKYNSTNIKAKLPVYKNIYIYQCQTQTLND